MTQRELTARMSSDPNTVASLLARMTEAGWVERKPHELDRRASRIRLLPSAEAMYVEVREVAIALQLEVLGVLPEAERERLLEQLDLVSSACRDAADVACRRGD